MKCYSKSHKFVSVNPLLENVFILMLFIDFYANVTLADSIIHTCNHNHKKNLRFLEEAEEWVKAIGNQHYVTNKA